MPRLEIHTRQRPDTHDEGHHAEAERKCGYRPVPWRVCFVTLLSPRVKRGAFSHQPPQRIADGEDQQLFQKPDGTIRDGIEVLKMVEQVRSKCLHVAFMDTDGVIDQW